MNNYVALGMVWQAEQMGSCFAVYERKFQGRFHPAKKHEPHVVHPRRDKPAYLCWGRDDFGPVKRPKDLWYGPVACSE